jgi:hypothetical protein
MAVARQRVAVVVTKQETFDHVVRSLIAQGKRSYHPDVGCMYRGPDGLKCAAGHCIPDDKYDPAMEGMVVVAPPRMEGLLPSEKRALRLLESALDGHDLVLMRELQSAHDSAKDEAFVESFTRKARIVAAGHDLDASACEVSL